LIFLGFALTRAVNPYANLLEPTHFTYFPVVWRVFWMIDSSYDWHPDYAFLEEPTLVHTAIYA